MVIDVEAKEYTLAESEALLGYLYRYYLDRSPGEEETDDISFLQEFGFAGLSTVLEIILNSGEMKEKAQNEFNEVWNSYFSHVPEPSTRKWGEVALRHGRARAKEELEEELARHKAELARALALIDAHDYVEAQHILEAAIAGGIADWFFYHHLGLVLYRQGKYTAAMPYYKEAIEGSPDDEWSWSCNDLKDCYEHSGLPDRFERGLEYFKTVIDRFPNRWVAYHECGWMCWKLNLLDEAIPYYHQALSRRKSDPLHLPTWGWTAHDLLEVYRIKGQLANAREFFSSISADHPQDWAIWYAQARLEIEHLGDANRLAMEFYERAVESQAPTWVLNEFGWYLRDLQRFDRALDVFSEARSRDPNDWEAWHGTGWILKSGGDWKAAKPHFEEALRRNPQSAWSWFELGYVYQNMTSVPLNLVYAWEAYEQTLVVDASNESARADALKHQAQLVEGTPGLQLYSFVEKGYSLGELQDLCFKLNIDDENLEARTKSSLTRELIRFCRRRPGKMLELVQQLHEERSDFPPLVETAANSNR